MTSSGIAAIGDVLMVSLPQHVPPGHEQEGERPAVVIGLPDRTGPQRFPLFVIVPLTTARGQQWALRNSVLYPLIPAGAGGLRGDSLALLDQVRALTTRRITGYVGTLPPEAFRPIREGLQRMLRI